jgi:excisionase family DNA binding protein
MDKLYTIQETMNLLRVSRQQVFRLRESGKLKFYEDGKSKRISEAHIKAYLNGIELDNGFKNKKLEKHLLGITDVYDYIQARAIKDLQFMITAHTAPEDLDSWLAPY